MDVGWLEPDITYQPFCPYVLDFVGSCLTGLVDRFAINFIFFSPPHQFCFCCLCLLHACLPSCLPLVARFTSTISVSDEQIKLILVKLTQVAVSIRFELMGISE